MQAIAVRVRLDTRDVNDAVAQLRREAPRVFADAINRTMHEVREAEQIDVSGSFGFSSSSTQRFLSRSFRFDSAKPDDLSAVLYVLPGSRTILDRQHFGALVRPRQPDVGPLLTADVIGSTSALAIPSKEITRTAGGRVPAARLPKRLLGRNRKGQARAYVAGSAVFERIQGQLRGRLLFGLSFGAQIHPRLDFFNVAVSTVRREFPKKAHRVLEKIRLRR